MKKRTDLTKTIRFWGLIFIIGLTVVITVIDIGGSYYSFKKSSENIRKEFTSQQKELVKAEVLRVVELIALERKLSEEVTRQKIKSRVLEAHAIVENIYTQNVTSKSHDEIQTMILDTLRNIRFNHGNGYYFAVRLVDTVTLMTARRASEGKSRWDLQDTKGKYIIRDMAAIMKQKNQGFYEYHWEKPDSDGYDFKKIVFIKKFEPYNWIIGTGLYVVDTDEEIKKHLLSTLSKIRFGNEGYIFINKFDGSALISNGKSYSGNKKLWEVFNTYPKKIKAIFDKEIQAAKKTNGDFIYYSWIKMNSPDIESPKTSFIYGIPDLQWLIGAGVYLDEVDADIAIMQRTLQTFTQKKIIYTVLIALLVIVLFLWLFNSISKKIKNDLDLLGRFFDQAATSGEFIDRDQIQ